MRRRTPKRQAQDEADEEGLMRFAVEFGKCWVCESRTGLQIHHIAGRNHPKRNDRANLFRACWKCHQEFTDSKRGLLEALARKRKYDPAGYNRLMVLIIRGLGPQAVTEEEVETYAINR